jgi:hypothetical protein
MLGKLALITGYPAYILGKANDVWLELTEWIRRHCSDDTGAS